MQRFNFPLTSLVFAALAFCASSTFAVPNNGQSPVIKACDNKLHACLSHCGPPNGPNYHACSDRCGNAALSCMSKMEVGGGGQVVPVQPQPVIAPSTGGAK